MLSYLNIKSKGFVSVLSRNMKSTVVIVLVIVVAFVLNLISNGRFLQISNLLSLLQYACYPALLTWGMSFIFTAGIIDLSLGANILLSANIGAICAVQFGLGYPGLILGTILSCVILEHLSMRCSQSLKLPSWIAGLGIALIFEAVLGIYSVNYSKKNAAATITLPPELRFFGTLEGAIVLLVVGGIAAYIIFNHTTIGINVRAIGIDENVSASMGINKTKTVFLGALAGAIFIGLASIRQISYASSLMAQTGLNSISVIVNGLAAFLLASSFSFMASMPVSIFFSSFFVVSIFNLLTMFKFQSGSAQQVFLGLIVILCGIMSQFGKKGVIK